MFSDPHFHPVSLVREDAGAAQHARAAGGMRDGGTPKTSAEIALKAAEAHMSMVEYTALAKDIAEGRADVRVYDEGIVVTRAA